MARIKGRGGVDADNSRVSVKITRRSLRVVKCLAGWWGLSLSDALEKIIVQAAPARFRQMWEEGEEEAKSQKKP